MKQPLDTLMRRNVSALQTIAYVVALFLGMCIVLVGLRFISDVRSARSAVAADAGYITLSKKVKPSGLFGASQPEVFTESEIDSLAACGGVRRIGRFSTASFDVTASVNGAGRGMSTALFLESVPDDFVDVRGMVYTPGRPVPIVIPADYLTLYNLGFAPARGLPTITPDMLGMVPVTLSVSGNGRQQTFAARIAGCSQRINTIAVPEAFLQQANATFGDDAGNEAPSRLILEVGSDQRELQQYIKWHGYEIGGGALSDGRLNTLLTIAATMVAGIGALIMVLALFLITVSLHLLLYKTRSIHHTLMLLGYNAATLSRRYIVTVAAVNTLATAAALAATAALRPLWHAPLASLGVAGGGWSMTMAVAGALLCALTAINSVTVVGLIRRSFRVKS